MISMNEKHYLLIQIKIGVLSNGTEGLQGQGPKLYVSHSKWPNSFSGNLPFVPTSLVHYM